MNYVIGCDIGSQSAKAVLLSPDGDIVGSGKHSYDLIHIRDGWVEQDPAMYRRAIAASIREALATASVAGGDVSHLAFCTQVDGVIPIDRNQSPLRNAITWLDRRAVPQTRDLDERVGETAIFHRTGLNLDPTHTATKIMWIADNEPEIYSDAASLPSIGGYVAAWLTGQSVQDHANSSSTLLYGLRARDWDDELLAAARIDRQKLPAITSAQHLVGNLLSAAADEIGLTPRCVVLTGTGDEHAAALGAGGIEPGVVVDIVGTAEPVGAASAELILDETQLLETHAHAVDQLYFIENPGFVSGGSTLWLSDNVLGISQSELFRRAGESTPGARGVRFVPALSGAMTPRWNAAMRGSFTGLAMNHTADDLARAVIEANAFAFRDLYERFVALGIATSVRAVGGGARSDLWLRTKATLCGVPIDRVTTDETAAVGAAMLAGITAGIFADVNDAVKRVVQISENAALPDNASAAALEDAYRDYRRVYDALEPLYT